MANIENLKNGKKTQFNGETAAKAGAKGGKATAKRKREKKAIKESYIAILSMPFKKGKLVDVEEIQNYAALKGKNISVQDAINIAVLQKALKGDVKAAEYIRDTIGEKPVDRVEHSGEVNAKLSDIMDQIGGEGLEE